MRLSVGSATYASQAPFGQTRAGWPSTVTCGVAAARGAEEKARVAHLEHGVGRRVATWRASGPRTGGTAGSAGDGASDSAESRERRATGHRGPAAAARRTRPENEPRRGQRDAPRVP